MTCQYNVPVHGLNYPTPWHADADRRCALLRPLVPGRNPPYPTTSDASACRRDEPARRFRCEAIPCGRRQDDVAGDHWPEARHVVVGTRVLVYLRSDSEPSSHNSISLNTKPYQCLIWWHPSFECLPLVANSLTDSPSWAPCRLRVPASCWEFAVLNLG